MIYTSSFGEGQPFLSGFHVSRGAVTIEKNVSVYSRAMILAGVRVRERTTVGAYALVNKDTEPATLVAGMPAKRIADSFKLVDAETQIDRVDHFLAERFDKIDAGTYKIGNTLILLLEKLPLDWTSKSNGALLIRTIASTPALRPRSVDTLFDLAEMTISGCANAESEYLRDKLRQQGARLSFLDYAPLPISWKRLVERGIERL